MCHVEESKESRETKEKNEGKGDGVDEKETKGGCAEPRDGFGADAAR